MAGPACPHAIDTPFQRDLDPAAGSYTFIPARPFAQNVLCRYGA